MKYAKDKQVVRCGNAVPPPFAEALVRASLPKKVSDARSGLNYNLLNTRGDFFMSKWNIAAKSPEEQGKVNVDLAASGVAYKERLNMPVVAEVVAREQPEHLREYFMERVRYYREQSIQLPRASDPRYIEMAEQNAKK